MRRTLIAISLIATITACGEPGLPDVDCPPEQDCTLDGEPVPVCQALGSTSLDLEPCWVPDAEHLYGVCRKLEPAYVLHTPCEAHTAREATAGGRICDEGGYCGMIVCLDVMVACPDPTRSARATSPRL